MKKRSMPAAKGKFRVSLVVYHYVDLIPNLPFLSFSVEDFPGADSPQVRDILRQELPNERFPDKPSVQAMVERSCCIAFCFKSPPDAVEMRPEQCH